MHEVLGDPVALRLDQSGWSSADALKCLRVLWYCYLHGPTKLHIRMAINALVGLPFAEFPALVTSIGDDQVVLRYGDTGSVFPGADNRGYVGRSIIASLSGTALFHRNGIYFDEEADIQVGDWILGQGDQEGNYTVRKVYSAPPSEPMAERATGSTNAAGLRFSDVGADWSQVQAGDLVEVRLPAAAAGVYPIASVNEGAGRCYLADRVRATGLITYRVIRRPWVRISQSISPGTLSGRLVRPMRAWPSNIWTGCLLTDSSGIDFTIVGNSASEVQLHAEVSPGPFSIRHPVATEVIAVIERPGQAAVLHEVGGYIRRFEPIVEGVQLTDWNTDERWHRRKPKALILAADADGTTSVIVDSTKGIAVNSTYRLEAEGLDSLQVVVSDVQAPDTIVLDTAIPATYTQAALARLVLERIGVEGFAGYYAVKEVSITGETNGTGLQLVDNGATFDDGSVKPGDVVRLVTDLGAVHIAPIDSVIDGQTMTVTTALPINQADAHYEIARVYEASDYATLLVDAISYTEQTIDESLIQNVLGRLLPSHLRYFLTTNAVVLFDAALTIEPGEDILEFISLSGTVDSTDLDGTASLDDDFILGPISHAWMEVFPQPIEDISPIELPIVYGYEESSITDLDSAASLDDDFLVGPYVHAWITEGDSFLEIIEEETYEWPAQPPEPGSNLLDGTGELDGDFTVGPTVDAWALE